MDGKRILLNFIDRKGRLNEMGEMTMQDIMNFVVNNGFAMFVAYYFMSTVTKVLQQNTLALNELKTTNDMILQKLDTMEG